MKTLENMSLTLDQISQFDCVNDLVEHSETYVGSPRGFNYNLNDKNAKSKLIKNCNRVPFETEEKSSCINLIFNVGAWLHVVHPMIQFMKQNMNNKTCQVGSSIIKIASIKTGSEVTGKHIDTQIIFFVDNAKAVCHFYQTTQLIMINGQAFKFLAHEFLIPLFQTKIEN